MWVRSAFWVGSPKPGADEEFHAAVNDELVPRLATLPGVRGARALWPRRLEDGPPDIACQVLVEFETRDDVDRMLASTGRMALRERVREIAGLFDGAISHIDYEVG